MRTYYNIVSLISNTLPIANYIQNFSNFTKLLLLILFNFQRTLIPENIHILQLKLFIKQLFWRVMLINTCNDKPQNPSYIEEIVHSKTETSLFTLIIHIMLILILNNT